MKFTPVNNLVVLDIINIEPNKKIDVAGKEIILATGEEHFRTAEDKQKATSESSVGFYKDYPFQGIISFINKETSKMSGLKEGDRVFLRRPIFLDDLKRDCVIINEKLFGYVHVNDIIGVAEEEDINDN